MNQISYSIYLFFNIFYNIYIFLLILLKLLFLLKMVYVLKYQLNNPLIGKKVLQMHLVLK